MRLVRAISCGDDAGVAAPRSSPRVCSSHHDLLERRVAGALADAVDRALDLPRARAGRRRTSWRRPGPGRRGSAPTARRRSQPGTSSYRPVRKAAYSSGMRVADRVGDVDRRRALLDGDRDHLGGELEVGARGVHRRELDVVDERLGVRDRGPRLGQDVLARVLQLVLDVDVRRRDEGVDARSLSVAYRLRRPPRCRPLERARARRSPGRRPRGRSSAPPRSRRGWRSGSPPR